MAGRTIERVVPCKLGGPISRLIGSVDVDGHGTEHDLDECDPCILLDQGTIPKHNKPPFGAHPHRGHSVVTVLLRGKMTSWDSFANTKVTIEGPASYWVDAGSGIFHNEVTVIEDESDSNQHASLFQLWYGVKEEDRTKAPAVSHDMELPEVQIQHEGKVVGTACYYVGGGAKIVTPRPLVVAHVSQNAKTTYRFPVDPKHTGFIVNLSGASYLKESISKPATFAGKTPNQVNDVLVLSKDGGDYIEVWTGDAPADYLVCVGEPHGEPWAKKLVANGAIIAATADEARDIASQVEGYSQNGKETGNFAPLGIAPSV
jgi:redox-sensitive bicupin YhaK (pirin superfamily)